MRYNHNPSTAAPHASPEKGVCEVNDNVYWVRIILALLMPFVLLAFMGVYLDALVTQQEEETRQQLGIQHPDWPWAWIDEGKIKLGMTDEMVRASWGNPSDINQSVGSWGIHEQWVYPRGSYDNDYLYFENGVLTSWQT